MPNHTENVLCVSGDPAELAEFENVCRGRSPQYVLSALERKFLPKSGEAEPETCLTFSGIVPVPPEVLAQTFDAAGYDWQRAAWGTKWDAYGPPELLRRSNGTLVYLFQTAWRPPKEWLRVAAERFKGLTFELFARDEYPYAVSIVATYDDGDLRWEECYGESVREEEAQGVPTRAKGDGGGE